MKGSNLENSLLILALIGAAHQNQDRDVAGFKLSRPLKPQDGRVKHCSSPWQTASLWPLDRGATPTGIQGRSLQCFYAKAVSRSNQAADPALNLHGPLRKWPYYQARVTSSKFVLNAQYAPYPSSYSYAREISTPYGDRKTRLTVDETRWRNPVGSSNWRVAVD